MLCSIVNLILIHLRVIVYPSHPLWKGLVLGGILEVIIFFVYTHFQDKRDLETNFGRKKKE